MNTNLITFTSPPIIVGLLGKAGSGKTTAAQHMAEAYGAKRISFAAPLKEMAKIIWEFTDEQVYGSTESKETWDGRWNVTPRLAMQRLGTSARQWIHPEVWIHAAFNTINNHYATHPEERLYVVDDVRFINEVKAIKDYGWTTGFVTQLVCSDVKSDADGSHPSESEMDSVDRALIDAVVTSHRTPESVHLKCQIDALMINSILPMLEKNK